MVGAGGGACAGESNTPLNAGKFVNGPGGTPAAVVAAPTAAHKLGCFPNGGAARSFVNVEAEKTPMTLCVFLFTKTLPGFVFGNVEPGGRISSGAVIPLAGGDHGPLSLTKALKRIASPAAS